MPSGSVSPVTRPKRVRTPTLPVGIEVVLHSKTNKIKTTSPSRRIRDPASRKFGIDGIEPPRSIPPPRVTFAMTASVAQLLQAKATRTASIIYYARQRFLFLRGVGIECANSLVQLYPNILWSFPLTPRYPWATIRANICPSQGNSGLATGRRRKRRYDH